MTVSFFKSLEARVAEVDSLLCVGLDPHSQDLPEQTAQHAWAFCKRIIDQTLPFAAAYKPNAAFFEALGPEGFEVLGKVIASIPDGVPVILDAKRGDIASTARAYATAALETLGADAITLNAYMGIDAVSPFIESPAKGAFVLCKTSNPSAEDLQLYGQGTAGRALFEEVAALAEGWNQNDNVGLVVGATQVEALRRVRAAAPGLWILAPGVGHQGGNLEAALEAGLRADGLGVLVPVSRGISRADNPGEAARTLRDQINAARQKVQGRPVHDALDALADALVDIGCIRFGSFTLKSGLESPIYIDLRRLITAPGVLAQVAAAYLPLMRSLEFDRLAALPYAALPIGTAVSLQSGWPMIFPRREAKGYGTRKLIEGEPVVGETIVVVDDLATTGGSKLEAIEKLQGADLKVTDIVVLIDRQSGAQQAMAKVGCTLHAVFTLRGLLERWERTGRVSAQQVQAVREFLEAHG